MSGQMFLFNIPPQFLWSCGWESLFPGRGAGKAAPGWMVEERMCRGAGHHGRTTSTEGAAGAAMGDTVLLGSPTKLLSLGKLPRVTTHSQLAVAQIAWVCSSPVRAAGVGGETVLAHVTYLIWKLRYPFVFSAATFCTISRPTTAFLLATHGPKLCFLPFKIMFLCVLFSTSFANCNNFFSRGHFFTSPYFTRLTIC